MNIQEFASSIKTKYPQYQNIDDTELTNKIIAKYPQYANKVDLTTSGGASGSWESEKLKPLYEQMDIKQNPIYATAQDVGGQFGTAFVNQLGYNLPKQLLKEQGISLPEPATKLGKLAEIAGGVGGVIGSPITRAVGGSMKLASKVPGLLGKTLLRPSVVGGAVGSAAYTPESETGAILSLPERGKQALLGAGLMGAGAVASKIPVGMKNSAYRMINSLIKPLKKDFAFGKNAGEGVVKEGIIATSFDDLTSKISKKVQEIGQKIKLVVSNPENQNKIINNSNIVAKLDNALAEASKSPKTNSALIERLQNAKDDILGAVESQEGVKYYTRDITKMTPLETFDLKRQVGDITKFTGNASDDALVNKALKQTYGQLKENLNKTVPDLVDLNERFANMKTADIAIKYRDKILQRQNMLNVVPKLAIGGGTLASLYTGNPAGLVGGLALAGLEKVAASTPFKTVVAKGLYKTGSGLQKVGRLGSNIINKTLAGRLAQQEIPLSTKEQLLNTRGSINLGGIPDEEAIKNIVSSAGGKYIGIQEGYKNIPPTVMFNEPTGSTLMVPINEISPETIKAKLSEYVKKKLAIGK